MSDDRIARAAIELYDWVKSGSSSSNEVTGGLVYLIISCAKDLANNPERLQKVIGAVLIRHAKEMGITHE